MAAALVLLHGLGAHAGVWSPMLATAQANWPGEVLAPDLRGHGAAAWRKSYALDDYASDVGAQLAALPEPAVVVGHSMGGAVALALASGRFGPAPAMALAFGTKAQWTPEEAAWLARLAASPVRRFDSREAAADRFLKAAGLAGLVALESPTAHAGVVQDDDGWRLAADPATAAVGPPAMDRLMAEARCPVHLAAGANDAMSPVAVLRAWDEDAEAFAGLGHNAMVEDPAAIWAWVRAKAGALNGQAS